MSTKRKPPRRKSGPPTQTPATWITARARNALRRPFFIATIGTLTFACAAAALFLVPRQAKRAAAGLHSTALQRPDTESTVAAMAQADREIAAAESTLVATREKLTQLVAATAVVAARDTAANGTMLTGDVRRQRSNLTAQVDSLTRMIDRSQNAPLLSAYRALAQAGPMQGDARVKGMLDSLVDIERERDSYNAVGGVDPVFVALTARANELGRNINVVATAKRDALKQELAALAPPAPTVPVAIARQPLPDTLAALQAREAAIAAASGVASRLAKERVELAQADARDERANSLTNLGASTSAIMLAALVLGAMIGFGVALFREVRHPRVSDMFEAERVSGVRVVSVVKPLPPVAERRRRSTDYGGPPYIDSGGDGHQLIYLTIANAGSNTVILTVTGDSPAVSAVIAVNFAAIAADEARATLIVDTNAEASTVSKMLHIREMEGLADVARNRREWPEVLRTARLGRDRAIDVVTSGAEPTPPEQLSATLAQHATRLARRYDAIVMVSSAEQVLAGLPAALPVTDVLYCARIGVTPIEELKQAVADIRKAGGNPRGLVLWNAADPVLEPETARRATTITKQEHQYAAQ